MHFCNDESLQGREENQLTRVLQAIGSQLDYSRILDTLQAEILLAYYLLHRNRRVEGSYHASAAVCIAVAGDLYGTCVFAARFGADGNQLPSPGRDADFEDRVRAFYIVCTLERCWSAWTTSSPPFPCNGASMESVSAPSRRLPLTLDPLFLWADVIWPKYIIRYESYVESKSGNSVQ
jgi:hypothetical protein